MAASSPENSAGAAGTQRQKMQASDKPQKAKEMGIKRPQNGANASERETSLPVSPLSWTRSAWHTLVGSPAAQLRLSAYRYLQTDVVAFETCLALVIFAYCILAVLGLKVVRGLTLSGSGGRRSRGGGRRAVLLGSSGSGKTSLFLLLRNGKATETVSSLQENIDMVSVFPAKSQDGMVEQASHQAHEATADRSTARIELVDFPGHSRLQGLSKPYIDQAGALLFLVDAADKASLKVAAEQLYELFANPSLHQRQTPLLLVVNKTDLPDSRPQASVVEDIEREIERSRASRAAMLEGEDDVTNFIGVEGEAFKILEHAPSPVEICSCSVKDDDTAEVRDFLLRHFPPK
ncbi:signal recognition particle receptor beta subunit protein [Toxoplasma gondii GAB2-2007-GAL-DOM2]|uniref:Signal recognition particle receptor subunit beta n=14 Tax=Toxoplasma gondii TaxID=5811 RepID=B9QEY3_TOXGV|nr:signal recognition particle receptor beta subunit protein [Toxoplasma gondii GT1]ESS33578.1 signal recognition particle receptor beta subunit protein [Toxoplasma gondii VEG]KAF4644298.1 signal recognition particle receptor beta subunit protein [Toxoplasma gondii]KFG32442.1 signal recognition particle receptor beta subunit protein [Toxoplasma gondii p89]KFG38316.1 signal recognition particle receptor beta subunit protein [Toxoplasma gondii GAB2-2007-GAL-DOM2]KFH01314.1 signal recognition par